MEQEKLLPPGEPTLIAEQINFRKALKVIGIIYFSKVYPKFNGLSLEETTRLELPLDVISIDGLYKKYHEFIVDADGLPFTKEELTEIIEVARRYSMILCYVKHGVEYVRMMP